MRDRRYHWLYLVIVILLAFLALPLLGRKQVTKPPGASGPATPFSYPHETLTKDAIIGLTNQARSANGLASLTENPLLDDIAQARAADMLEKQYFAHLSPTGEQASDIAQRIGYPYRIIAENIASGMFLTNQKLIDGWMQSPGHRENILSPAVKEMGAAIMKGVLNGQEAYVSVQIFGLQSPPVNRRACDPPSEALLEEIQTKKAELDSRTEALRKTKRELDAEADEIDSQRRAAGGSAREVGWFNTMVRAYNEKSNEYNQSLAESRAAAKGLQSLVDEYNRQLEAYNSCQKRD